MTKRRLTVTKWLGTTPAVASCALCGRTFKAPMNVLTRSTDAQSYLLKQFEQHVCVDKPAQVARPRMKILGASFF